jgi:hyaluronan synthase
MFALCRGRAVHQPSAVSLPVYPETVSHHLRQWTRWMRASTIRTFWRIRYLPILSYGWLYMVYTLWAFFTSVAITIVIPLAWPATRNLAIASGIALIAWPCAIAVRIATVRRSDQRWYGKLTGVLLLLPAAALRTKPGGQPRRPGRRRAAAAGLPIPGLAATVPGNSPAGG